MRRRELLKSLCILPVLGFIPKPSIKPRYKLKVRQPGWSTMDAQEFAEEDVPPCMRDWFFGRKPYAIYKGVPLFFNRK